MKKIKIVGIIISVIYYAIKIYKELTMETLLSFLWNNAILVSLTGLFIFSIWLIYSHFTEKIKILKQEIHDDTDMLILGMDRRIQHIYSELKKNNIEASQPEKYLSDEEIKLYIKAFERLTGKKMK